MTQYVSQKGLHLGPLGNFNSVYAMHFTYKKFFKQEETIAHPAQTSSSAEIVYLRMILVGGLTPALVCTGGTGNKDLVPDLCKDLLQIITLEL